MAAARMNAPVRTRLLLVAATLCGLGLLLSGCGGDDGQSPVSASDDSSTGDEAQTSATEVVEEPTAAGQPAEVTAEPEAPAAAAEPVAAPEVRYSEAVHPILEDSCASCHGPGGPGSTGVALATAADASEAHENIAKLTGSGAMPPWPASHLSVDFVGDYSLADDQIAAIKAWSDAGGAIDVDPDTPIVSTRPLARLQDPDLTLTSEKGAYQGSPARTDDYRCLIFDPELTETEWILASHFEPDQVEIVHHGIITLASQELREQAEGWDALEAGPGWTCYGGTGLSTRDGGYEFGIGGWAPGAPPARQPDGYAIPMRPGDFVIVQIHYHFEEDAPPDLSRMVFDFASDEEIAAEGGAYKTLQGQLYLGPAEIPCYEGDTNPLCDRDLALERVRDLYGEFGAVLPDAFLRQCGQTPADYAEMTDGTAWSTCDLPVRNPGRIVSVTGHMHELGLSIRLTLNPDTPEERILLDIPDWDFEWQLGYRPVEDIIIDRDDIIRVDCAWNRERAPYQAVGYILWAEGTGDEMCYSSITTAPLT